MLCIFPSAAAICDYEIASRRCRGNSLIKTKKNIDLITDGYKAPNQSQ